MLVHPQSPISDKLVRWVTALRVRKYADFCNRAAGEEEAAFFERRARVFSVIYQDGVLSREDRSNDLSSLFLLSCSAVADSINVKIVNPAPNPIAPALAPALAPAAAPAALAPALAPAPAIAPAPSPDIIAPANGVPPALLPSTASLKMPECLTDADGIAWLESEAPAALGIVHKAKFVLKQSAYMATSVFGAAFLRFAHIPRGSPLPASLLYNAVHSSFAGTSETLHAVSCVLIHAALNQLAERAIPTVNGKTLHQLFAIDPDQLQGDTKRSHTILTKTLSSPKPA